MPDFIFVYHGGKAPESEAEQKDVMARWGDWMQTNGAAMKDPGNPVGMSKTVSAAGVADDGGSNPASGYTIVSAGSMDDALAMAKTCPMVTDGGSVEVAEIHPIEM